MAPLIAALLKNGLGLVANAVMAKGQDWVEEKTGVKLAENMSSEDMKALRIKQMEHEEELLKLQQEDNRLDLQAFQAEVQDKDSARQRDASFRAAGIYNFRADAMFLLAVGIIIWLVYQVWHAMGVDEFTKAIVTLILGRFLGYLDNMYNFEFGTTRSNKAKDSTIEQLSRKGQ